MAGGMLHFLAARVDQMSWEKHIAGKKRAVGGGLLGKVPNSKSWRPSWVCMPRTHRKAGKCGGLLAIPELFEGRDRENKEGDLRWAGKPGRPSQWALASNERPCLNEHSVEWLKMIPYVNLGPPHACTSSPCMCKYTHSNTHAHHAHTYGGDRKKRSNICNAKINA